MKPHIHAAVIHAFADGAKVQVMTRGEWYDCKYPDFEASLGYRVKPAAPKWPQTTMTHGDLSSAYGNMVMEDPLRDVENAALAHACESGQVVPADKVREIEAKAREQGMKEGSQWDSDRDRMVIRETLKSQGISWNSVLVDHIVYGLPK